MPSTAWTMMEVHWEVRCWKINVGKRDVFVFCEYAELFGNIKRNSLL